MTKSTHPANTLNNLIFGIVEEHLVTHRAPAHAFGEFPKRPRSPFINCNTLRITDVKANLDWNERQLEIEAGKGGLK